MGCSKDAARPLFTSVLLACSPKMEDTTARTAVEVASTGLVVAMPALLLLLLLEGGS
jgi:hypothetical protein